MEKIIDNYTRREPLSITLLRRYQFAYQVGKSAETALHNFIRQIEGAFLNKEVALCAFIDLYGTCMILLHTIQYKTTKIIWTASKFVKRLLETNKSATIF